uniref:SCP domain-containing protein n=1 Tax=Haemonchus contortus TaxID=6289 RepID=A0A7I4XT78_HAECO
MFLQTVVFLLQLPAGGSSPDYDDPIPITYEDFTLRTTEYINSVRQVVANGQVVESKWGSVNPPTSKHMFRLKWSPEMETYAGINVQGCQSSNSIPSGGSLSFNTIQLSGDTASDSLSTTNKFSRVMPQDFNYTKGTLTLFNEVLWNWTDPLYYNLTDGQGQVIYNDKTMEPFANMMYYKATEVGCAVQICNNIFATACVFNKAPQWGEPIYIANPNSNGCSTNEDCSSIKKGYVCLTSGFRQGLCTYPDDTTTARTTTTPTTPAPGRSAPSEATPTSATGKTTLAAGSTKSTGPTEETEPSSTVATTTSQSDYIIKLINEMRAQVAAGKISTLYGPLPSSLHMFQLESSPELEVYAKNNTMQCQTKNYTPSGSSMNYYTFYETPGSNFDKATLINLALASWMEEILHTNFGNQVTYANQNLQEFANMIYYKSTKAGCACQKCNQPAPPRAVVACIFNSAPESGKPIYLGTAGATGCNNDEDCSSVINGAKCGPQGLCGYSSTTTKDHYHSGSFIELINGMREKVAKGDLSTSYGPLPSSSQMFQVEYSPELEVYAQINTIQCQNENYTPPGSSMSYYRFYETPGKNLSNITVINLALASWMQEILNTNFGSQFTYTNQNMKNFANMIYYKSTKAGCSYQSCSNLTSPVAVVACVFDSAPQLGKPIYPSTQGVNGCNKDSDCSAVIFGTTCGPRGLCGYSFSSTTVST